MPQRKISSGQLLLLLLLARLMHTMIFRFDYFTSGTPIMLGLLITTAIEAVIAIPAVVWLDTGGDARTRPLPKWLAFLYSAYFTVIAGGTAALFAEFLHIEFADTVAPIAAMILIAAIAAYCSHLGIEALARAGTVVFWLFVGFFIWMSLVSEGSFDWLNIQPLVPGDGKTLFEYVVESLSSAWWIPMLCILGSHLRKGAWKAAYGFLACKLVIIGSLMLIITLVLWKYVAELGYPIFAIGAYAKSGFIQRFDAINMLIWAINCVTVAAVYIFIASKPIKKPLTGSVIFAAIAAAFAIYEYKRGMRYDEPWFLWFKFAGIILLGIAVPIAGIVIRKVTERKAHAAGKDSQ